jgi:xylulokinase
LIFNPSLAGGSAAHPSSNVRGAYVGLDLSHTINDVVRSTMEGVAYELRMVLDTLRELCFLSEDILLVGGGSKSKAWRQIFADILNANIVKTNIGQGAGSLGAAAVAAIGSGLWKSITNIESIHQVEDISRPIKGNVIKYNELLEAYRYSWEFLSKYGDMVSRINMK